MPVARVQDRRAPQKISWRGSGAKVLAVYLDEMDELEQKENDELAQEALEDYLIEQANEND
jgi:hypothetical protein